MVRKSENTRAAQTREIHFIARDTLFQLHVTPSCYSCGWYRRYSNCGGKSATLRHKHSNLENFKKKLLIPQTTNQGRGGGRLHLQRLWSDFMIDKLILFDLFCRYLLENQLSGPSSVEAYIDALKKGCKCVECKCELCCKGKNASTFFVGANYVAP